MADSTKTKQQTMRFSDTELATMKHNFAENHSFFMALRKHMLQFPLSKSDTEIIHGGLVGKPEAFAVISKTFLPVLDPDAPFSQMIDLWMTFEIKDKLTEQVLPTILARQIVIDYLQQQLDLLGKVGTNEAGVVADRIVFADMTNIQGKSDLQMLVNLTARNTLITHIDAQCNQILLLAGKTEETPEQTKERLAKDSAK